MKHSHEATSSFLVLVYEEVSLTKNFNNFRPN